MSRDLVMHVELRETDAGTWEVDGFDRDGWCRYLGTLDERPSIGYLRRWLGDHVTIAPS